MPDVLQVILFASLPVAGHLCGAALALSTRPPRWIAGAALHGSAGIAIALVSMDLMPRITPHVPVWQMVMYFLAGALLSLTLVYAIGRLQNQSAQSRVGAFMAYTAIGADLVSDGLMTGAGFAVESQLGILLATAQAVANVPGGFAATANLNSTGISRSRALLVAAAISIPVLLSALGGMWLLSDASDLVKHAALMIIVGLLLLATVEDMIPEADAPKPPRWLSTVSFTAGFIGLALSSRYLG